MLNDIKTDEKLLNRLKNANDINKKVSMKQRVSFIYGALSSKSAVTKHQIEDTLSKFEGEIHS